MPFPFVKQPDAMDCGPACLKMVSAFYRKNFSLETIRRKCFITREGVSFLGLSEAADSLGFKTLGVRIPLEMLEENVPLPCIVHWKQRHFIVVYKIKNNRIWAADPAIGMVRYDRDEFIRNWTSTMADGKPSGLVLIIEPTPSLFEKESEHEKSRGFRFLFKYFRLYERYLFQLLLGLLIGSCIQLIIPFLTQSIIDIGLNNNDLGFIYLILFAQLALVIGRMSVEFIRGWLLLHIGTRVNVAIVSGFLQKLMSLPLAFFDTKLTGAVLYVIWVSLFMKPRAKLDQQRFKQMSLSGNKLINIVNGMQEIKLTQSETGKRWDWEKLQATLFGLKIKGLGIIQYQSAGATFINEVTNLLITVVAATAVLRGNMTLGAMLAVQFIIGQLNVPVSQIITFFRMSQDAKMSLDRLSEVHEMQDEEPDPEYKVRKLPEKKDIFVNNVSFQYEGPHSPYALKDVDLFIEENRTTAIVGTSGSGKTTLLKLLLGFYQPVAGDILIGDTRLSNISLKVWRQKTRAVMQDGFLFPETIAANIAPGK